MTRRFWRGDRVSAGPKGREVFTALGPRVSLWAILVPPSGRGNGRQGGWRAGIGIRPALRGGRSSRLLDPGFHPGLLSSLPPSGRGTEDREVGSPETGFGEPCGAAAPSPVQTQGFTLGYSRPTLREGETGKQGAWAVCEGGWVGLAELAPWRGDTTETTAPANGRVQRRNLKLKRHSRSRSNRQSLPRHH